MPEVGGVVHTHSTYATAWAARGEPIPCVITAMADEFGGEIPVGPFAIIGDDSIGRGHRRDARRATARRAVLMQNHGVFTIGKDARDAVKAAVMVEDVARTVHLARQLGEPIPIPAESIDSLFDRYQNVYGQKPSRSTRMTPRPPSTTVPRRLEEVWFLTGSQGLYGEETLRQVAEQSKAIADELAAASGVPVELVWKPVLTDAEAISRTMLEANVDDTVIGVIAWMHTFSPAKMWIARPRRPAASRCCTCTRRRTSSCPGPRSTSTS